MYVSLLDMCKKERQLDRLALKYFDLYKLKVWPQNCPLKFIGNIEKCEFKNAYGCACVYISLWLNLTHAFKFVRYSLLTDPMFLSLER